MTFRLLLSSLTTIAIGAGLAFGASPADQQIAARQAEMKANGKAMEALVAILKGDTTYDPAFVKTNVEAMIAAKAAGEAARGWDAGSQRGTVETQAKPEIWTDAAGFADGRKAVDDALAGLAATSDEAGFKKAFMALGAACKSCHEKFRRPKG